MGGRAEAASLGKLTPVNDLLLDGVSPCRFPTFDGLWSGDASGAARINIISLLLTAAAFSRTGLCGFRIVGERRLPPPAVMDFRYRKVLARELFSCATRRFVARSIFVKSKQIYF